MIFAPISGKIQAMSNFKIQMYEKKQKHPPCLPGGVKEET